MRTRPCTVTGDCCAAAATMPRPSMQPAEWQTRTFLVATDDEDADEEDEDPTLPALPYAATTAAASALSSSNA